MADKRTAAGKNLAPADDNEIMFLSSAAKMVLFTPPKTTIDYQKKFDPARAPIFRPTKTVVVSQDPAADQVVPAGTEVKVTLAAKGSLPVGTFQVAPSILDKYRTANIDILLNDLDTKGQAVIPILVSEKAYELLSQPEKNAVTEYANSVGLNANTEADAKAIFEDIQFFHNF